jgi:superfamily I DNA/RNA helicase
MPPSLTEKPIMIKLSKNFRSHGKIIELANSIIKLLTMFFPHTIDRMSPEISTLDGCKPLFINNINTLKKLMMVNVNKDETNIIGRV